jgi:hypothetical protein
MVMGDEKAGEGKLVFTDEIDEWLRFSRVDRDGLSARNEKVRVVVVQDGNTNQNDRADSAPFGAKLPLGIFPREGSEGRAACVHGRYRSESSARCVWAHRTFPLFNDFRQPWRYTTLSA